MEFKQNEWIHRDVINKIRILTKQGTDMIHTVILMKYQKYPSTTILKHANVLAEVNKLPYGRLPYMMPQEAYSIPTHIHKMILADIGHEQRE